STDCGPAVVLGPEMSYATPPISVVRPRVCSFREAVPRFRCPEGTSRPGPSGEPSRRGFNAPVGECAGTRAVPLLPRRRTGDNGGVPSESSRMRANPRGVGWRPSERLQGGLLLLHDLEELVELGDFEDFVDLRIDIAEDEPAARLLQLLVQGDQLA